MGIENPVHLLFIAIVALVVLGPRRLPDLARALGKGVREFREAIGQGEGTPPSDPPVGLQPSIGEERIGEDVPTEALHSVPADAPPSAAAPEPTHEAPAAHEATRDEPPGAPAGAAVADRVDPTQAVRSGGAPDRRPL
jgi:TatA/E family protein of Tat protein translocase